MIMPIFQIILSSIILPTFAHYGHTDSSKTVPLIVMSMDGFRWDFVHRIRAEIQRRGNITDHFRRFLDNGVFARDGVRNVFVTKTFPNHYSMVTGLYEESHGIVSNIMFDPALNRSVNLMNSSEPYRARLFQGEPIWMTMGQQRGVGSASCYMWPACDYMVKNYSIPAMVPYRSGLFCDEHVKMLDYWLTAGVQLHLFYFNEPDHTGHEIGPDHPDLMNVLLKLNDCLGRMLAVLDKRSMLPDHANVMLVSDHGMVKFTDLVVIPIREDLYTVHAYDYSEAMLSPHKGKLNESIEFLEGIAGIKVFTHEHIPEQWHYSNNQRIDKVLLVADIGIQLDVRYPDGSSMTPAKLGAPPLVAGHGYNNTEHIMWPTFMAMGRNFEIGKVFTNDTAESNIRTVDYYSLMCQLLGVVAAPNNGSSLRYETLVRNMPRVQVLSALPQPTWTVFLIMAVVLGWTLLCLLAQNLSSRRKEKNINAKNNARGYALVEQEQLFSVYSDSDV